MIIKEKKPLLNKIDSLSKELKLKSKTIIKLNNNIKKLK